MEIIWKESRRLKVCGLDHTAKLLSYILCFDVFAPPLVVTINLLASLLNILTLLRKYHFCVYISIMCLSVNVYLYLCGVVCRVLYI